MGPIVKTCFEQRLRFRIPFQIDKMQFQSCTLTNWLSIVKHMNHYNLFATIPQRYFVLLLGVLLFLSIGTRHLSADEQQSALLKQFVKELVPITPGKGIFPKSFQMGSTKGPPNETPVHTVTFSYDFWIGKYEVPQNLYESVMGENPSRWKGPRNSAEEFDWHTANQFCQKITQLLRKESLIGPNEEIRLPTEAEWEYCCRAGTNTEYSFGDQAQKTGDTGKIAKILDEYAWHTGNAAGNDPPVGALKPNPWGLYDMHGYLWEFVADPWHDNYKNAPQNGKVWGTGTPESPRVIRGGAWTDRYDLLRSAFRRKVTPTTHSPALGLRCVKAKVKKSEN